MRTNAVPNVEVQIGGRKLGPGNYVLAANPSAGGRIGNIQKITFEIVR